MDDAMGRALAEWAGFYTLLGGAGATLLGLLFVSLSLRLNVFREQVLADVRDFATLAFATFLVAIVIAALALAPHPGGLTFAIALGLLGVAGLLLLAWFGREWIRLNVRQSGPISGPVTSLRQLPIALLGLGSPYLGLLVAAGLVGTRHPHAWGWLAITEVGLLAIATIAAWIMLTNARPDTGAL
jgi:hypothetical protein